MTTFHTNTSEIYHCRDCEAHIEHYHDLKHYSEDSGGFCPCCDSDDLKVMTSYIVYQQVWATDESDSANTAVEIDEWNIITGSVTA